MDYTNMSLTQAKRLEMESQVKALELEKELEMERTRLAELRKVHYHLAGASEGWEEVSREDALPCKLALPLLCQFARVSYTVSGDCGKYCSFFPQETRES